MENFDLRLIKEFLDDNYAEFQIFLETKELDGSEADVIIGSLEKEINEG